MKEAASKNVPHLRETVPLYDYCDTRLGRVVDGGSKSRQRCHAQAADSRDAVCKYGVVADAHGYIARYATSRGVQLGRAGITRARM